MDACNYSFKHQMHFASFYSQRMQFIQHFNKPTLFTLGTKIVSNNSHALLFAAYSFLSRSSSLSWLIAFPLGIIRMIENSIHTFLFRRCSLIVFYFLCRCKIYFEKLFSLCEPVNRKIMCQLDLCINDFVVPMQKRKKTSQVNHINYHYTQAVIHIRSFIRLNNVE